MVGMAVIGTLPKQPNTARWRGRLDGASDTKKVTILTRQPPISGVTRS
jgi:hypothetical protein